MKACMLNAHKYGIFGWMDQEEPITIQNFVLIKPTYFGTYSIKGMTPTQFFCPVISFERREILGYGRLKTHSL